MGWIRNKLILWNFCSKLDSFNLICQAPCQICPIWYTGIFEMDEAYAGDSVVNFEQVDITSCVGFRKFLSERAFLPFSTPRDAQTLWPTGRQILVLENNHIMFDRKFLEGLVFKIKISGLGQNRPRDDASIMKLKWRSC